MWYDFLFRRSKKSTVAPKITEMPVLKKSPVILIGDRIIEVAEKFEGLVEVINNAEWDDPKTKGPDARAVVFEAMLKRAGHQDGWPYCASYVEGSWVTAYTEAGASPALIARIRLILSPHVMTSYRAAKAAGLITRTPARGAVGFMTLGGSDSGHMFLVKRLALPFVRTIEANTSPTPSDVAGDRDGGLGSGGVWGSKQRLYAFNRTSGLWLRGFMNPLPI